MEKSNRVTLRDARRLFHLLEEVCAQSAEPVSAQKHLLVGLCRLVGARQGSTLELTGWSPQGEVKLTSVQHAGWASDEALQVWEEAVLMNQPRLDPLIDRSTRIVGAVQTRLRVQIIADDVLEQVPAYTDLAKLAGVSDNLCGWFARSEPHLSAVSAMTFHRQWGEARFTARDRNVLHLANVELARLHRQGLFNGPRVREPGPELSPQLRQLLRALIAGDSVKQAAAKLGVTFRTAEGYVKLLYRQFEVHSRAELFAKVFTKPEFAERK